MTAPMFSEEIEKLCRAELISPKSKILFVDDGSRDRTWEIISSLSAENPVYTGIRHSRNRLRD